MSFPLRVHDRPLGWVVLALMGTAALVSLVSGTPSTLPGVALGSEVRLHLERGVAAFAALLLALLVLVRAFEGRLPDELSGRGLAYASRDGVEALRAEVKATLDDLEAAHAGHAAAIASLDARVADMEPAE